MSVCLCGCMQSTEDLLIQLVMAYVTLCHVVGLGLVFILEDL